MNLSKKAIFTAMMIILSSSNQVCAKSSGGGRSSSGGSRSSSSSRSSGSSSSSSSRTSFRGVSGRSTASGRITTYGDGFPNYLAWSLINNGNAYNYAKNELVNSDEYIAQGMCDDSTQLAKLALERYNNYLNMTNEKLNNKIRNICDNKCNNTILDEDLAVNSITENEFCNISKSNRVKVNRPILFIASAIYIIGYTGLECSYQDRNRDRNKSIKNI